MDIQNLKSQIVGLQQKLQSTTIIEVVSILSNASEKQYLMEQHLENEVEKIRGQLFEFQSQMKSEKGELERNKQEHFEKYKNNVEMLKK